MHGAQKRIEEEKLAALDRYSNLRSMSRTQEVQSAGGGLDHRLLADSDAEIQSRQGEVQGARPSRPDGPITGDGRRRRGRCRQSRRTDCDEGKAG